MKTRPILRQPRGAALVTVMICLSIVMALLFSLSRNVILTGRQLRLEQALRQAEWLLHAGEERAFHQLQTIPGFRGERWQCPLRFAGRETTGLVTIVVEASDQVTPTQITLQAQLESALGSAIVRTRVIVVPTPTRFTTTAPNPLLPTGA